MFSYPLSMKNFCNANIHVSVSYIFATIFVLLPHSRDGKYYIMKKIAKFCIGSIALKCRKTSKK